MRGKIVLIASLIIVSVVTNARAEEIKLQPIDFSHPAVKATIARQKALASGELDFLWGQLSKKTQEIWGPDGFREFHLSPVGKNRDALISKAELSGIRVISDSRVWIEASVRELTKHKGLYFIKEDGEWRFVNIYLYLEQVEKDLGSLSNKISEYYQKNKKLPQSLSELSAGIPVDLFSDSEAAYQYKILTNISYMLYSLGPDSDDDNGLVEYSRKEHPISDGDIIKKVVVQ